MCVAVTLHLQSVLGMAPEAVKSFGTLQRNSRNTVLIVMCGLAVAAIDCAFVAMALLGGQEFSATLFYQITMLPMLAGTLGFAIDGVVRGEVVAIWAGTGSFRRADQPVRYWIALLLCVLLSIACTFGALGIFGVIA